LHAGKNGPIKGRAHDGRNVQEEHHHMTKNTPAKTFAVTVEHLAADFIGRIADPEQVAKATGRLALAIRSAGTANPKVYELFEDRLQAARVREFSDVKQDWPDLRSRILREGINAF
jgi:hypothetical protein